VIGRLGQLPEPQPKLVQLRVVDRCGRPGQQIGATGGLRNAITSRIESRAREQRDDAVEPYRDAAVGGAP
jgi:hypothetical protein